MSILQNVHSLFTFIKKEKNLGTNVWVTKNTRAALAFIGIFSKP